MTETTPRRFAMLSTDLWLKLIIKDANNPSPHRIGLSVSTCVLQMANGEVDPKKVELIVAGTASRNWGALIQSYRERVWFECPDRAEEVLRYFLDRGLVYQPRHDPSVREVPNTWREGAVFWAESLDEIVWGFGG